MINETKGFRIMYDHSHKEGDKYHYTCKKCGYDRGILDNFFYSTICTRCKAPYHEERIRIKDLG